MPWSWGRAVKPSRSHHALEGRSDGLQGSVWCVSKSRPYGLASCLLLLLQTLPRGTGDRGLIVALRTKLVRVGERIHRTFRERRAKWASSNKVRWSW